MAETTTIARPYAQAVFKIAQEKGDLKAWSEMLQLAAAVAADAEMAAVIDSPKLGASQVADLFVDVCGDKLSDSGKNLIRVLAENDRLPLLPDIAALYEMERATAEGTVEADVVSATELSDAQKQAIADALKKRLGREVTLNCRTDADMVGGAIIRAGDVVIDGSVSARLEKLGSQLLR